jgi:hypothetical protein
MVDMSCRVNWKVFPFILRPLLITSATWNQPMLTMSPMLWTLHTKPLSLESGLDLTWDYELMFW